MHSPDNIKIYNETDIYIGVSAKSMQYDQYKEDLIATGMLKDDSDLYGGALRLKKQGLNWIQEEIIIQNDIKAVSVAAWNGKVLALGSWSYPKFGI